MTVDVIADGLGEILHVVEGATAQALLGEVPEPPFDQIEPRGTGGREMNGKAAMPGQPYFDPRMRMGAVIIQDQMESQLGRRFSIQFAQETEKFLVPMPRHAFAQHGSLQDVQGRKRGRGIVALVVMRQRAASPLLHRQAGLGAVQGLDLTLLVHAQHQSPVGRIQVQAHDVGELLHKVRVARQLEGARAMRLQAVRIPDAPHHRLAHALGAGHRASAPMSRRQWLLMQGGFHDLLHLLGTDLRLAAAPRGIFGQGRRPAGHKAPAPEQHAGPAGVQLSGDAAIGYSRRRLQNDLGSQN